MLSFSSINSIVRPFAGVLRVCVCVCVCVSSSCATLTTTTITATSPVLYTYNVDILIDCAAQIGRRRRDCWPPKPCSSPGQSNTAATTTCCYCCCCSGQTAGQAKAKAAEPGNDRVQEVCPQARRGQASGRLLRSARKDPPVGRGRAHCVIRLSQATQVHHARERLLLSLRSLIGAVRNWRERQRGAAEPSRAEPAKRVTTKC